jgi:hypothetical protein
MRTLNLRPRTREAGRMPAVRLIVRPRTLNLRPKPASQRRAPAAAPDQSNWEGASHSRWRRREFPDIHLHPGSDSLFGRFHQLRGGLLGNVGLTAVGTYLSRYVPEDHDCLVALQGHRRVTGSGLSSLADNASHSRLLLSNPGSHRARSGSCTVITTVSRWAKPVQPANCILPRVGIRLSLRNSICGFAGMSTRPARAGAPEPLNLLPVLPNIPFIQQRQVLQLQHEGQVADVDPASEEIRVNRAPASRTATMALPHHVTETVDAVVVGDLLPGQDGPQRYHPPHALDGLLPWSAFSPHQMDDWVTLNGPRPSWPPALPLASRETRFCRKNLVSGPPPGRPRPASTALRRTSGRMSASALTTNLRTTRLRIHHRKPPEARSATVSRPCGKRPQIPRGSLASTRPVADRE